MKRLFYLLTASLIVHLGFTAVAISMPSTQVVAVTDDPAPGSGTISHILSTPVLNDAGQTAFLSALVNTNDGAVQGIFRGDGDTSLVEIIRDTAALPGGNGNYTSLSNPAINNSGQVIFETQFITAGVSSGSILYADELITPVQIMYEGQVAPGGDGEFLVFDAPAFNDAGKAAFFTTLINTSDGNSDNRGIYLSDGGVSPTQIVRTGQAAPDGNGSFSGFSSFPVLNNANQVAFRGTLTGTGGGASGPRGIFRGDGQTGPIRIARAGLPAPDGNGSFSSFGDPALNEAGQVAFRAGFSGTSGGSDDSTGIFRGDGLTDLTQIARAGQAAPDGNGAFSSFGSPALNEVGQAAFIGVFTDTTGGSSDKEGMFRADGITGPVQIARAGQAAPDGNGYFFEFLTGPALNDAGQMAFLASLTGTNGGSSDGMGLFFYDDVLGLVPVARLADSFLGSTIVNLDFAGGHGGFGEERSGMNELGQVAYSFTLADGHEGVAIWTIPEPGTLSLFVIGGILCWVRGGNGDM